MTKKTAYPSLSEACEEFLRNATAGDYHRHYFGLAWAFSDADDVIEWLSAAPG